jgi:pimeloyl-ACP methyl ester carboxylesterase
VSYVDIGEAELWVEDTGGDGTPLVLLHAAAGNARAWDVQRPLFEASGIRVITLDQRGFGQTRVEPGKETSGSVAGDLEALVSQLNLPRFFLLGTAYGGFGAVEFAADNPDALKAFVLSTSIAGITDSEFAALRKELTPPSVAELPVAVRELGGWYRESDPEGVKRFEAMEHGSHAAGFRQPTRQPNTLARLGEIKAPSLVIAGGDDTYIPEPVMKLIADSFSGAEYEIIPDVGHSPFWEKPEVWNEVVTRFLKKHD